MRQFRNIVFSTVTLMLLAACSSSPRLVAPAPQQSPVMSTSGTDQWSHHIREASLRFNVPETYIRSVMTIESGGRTMMNGRPITSRSGAMGLMQVMPPTFRELSRKHNLGNDPHDPRANILAGTAYIREMHDIYGYPGFLAAYNCGPGCYGSYLAGERSLPLETQNYLIKGQTLIAQATGQPQTTVVAAAMPQTTAPSRTPPPAATISATPLPAPTPATTAAPILTRPQPTQTASLPAPTSSASRTWGVQVGAFSSPDGSRRAAERAREMVLHVLQTAEFKMWKVSTSSGELYRSQLVGLSEDEATYVCDTLVAQGGACIRVSDI
ncbi:lytic transglycosylase domain-containing protein [Thalassospira sp.]|uniref:lytic transglycosylase domain-containing protein n=1 Tax=Thalassospira sp. TaxID=1912094 RepID=UPI00273468D6|nr:lytic transglycosylase domain-containing protein [Thalassospira sp.]MDP2696555.1 lytic transglycosylase domain-containing protein [Thalassospira sp.]